jgi:predicted RNA polymerase sigma factor
VQDGPYADTKEQLGGFTVLELLSLDAALTAWPRDEVPRGMAADDGAPLAHRFYSSSASRLSRRVHSFASQGNPTEATLETKFPDERLKLLFVYAHPAIDPAMHTSYAADRTWPGCGAHCWCLLISPKTMVQRLVRAKTKIRDGGIRFEIPQDHGLPQRLDAVLEAIYAAFGIGWDDIAGGDQRGRDPASDSPYCFREVRGHALRWSLAAGRAQLLRRRCLAHRRSRAAESIVASPSAPYRRRTGDSIH